MSILVILHVITEMRTTGLVMPLRTGIDLSNVSSLNKKGSNIGYPSMTQHHKKHSKNTKCNLMILTTSKVFNLLIFIYEDEKVIFYPLSGNLVPIIIHGIDILFV